MAEKMKKGPSEAGRKTLKCPHKQGINLNMREQKGNPRLTLLVGCLAIVILAGCVAKFGVIDQYRRLDAAQALFMLSEDPPAYDAARGEALQVGALALEIGDVGLILRSWVLATFAATPARKAWIDWLTALETWRYAARGASPAELTLLRRRARQLPSLGRPRPAAPSATQKTAPKGGR